MDETKTMTFKALQQTNKQLYKNPELSEHNKEVLEDFFRKARAGGGSKPTLRDYSSRFNKIINHTDFKLDQPTQEDLELLISKFNQDQIKKNNGKKYSDYSKNKFWKTLSKFYNSFIKRKGKGYNEDIDGPELIEDLEISVELSTEVNPDSLPTPSEVRKVVNHSNSLRDKAVILIGWASGARIGEIFETNYDKNILKWRDVTFEKDKAWIKLEGKTGEREVPVKTGRYVLEELWENSEADPSDPVFTKRDKTYYCPECGTKTSSDDRKTFDNRVYECKSSECDWNGSRHDVDRRVEALTDHAVRRILDRTVERAGMSDKFKSNPHGFFRKSRAMYKVRIGNTEHQLRAFFGWSETSDAPKHYIECVKEDLEKALAEEFGEEVEYDNGYDEEALRPVECVSCGKVNSPVNDLCGECGNALNDQGSAVTRSESSQGLSDSLSELAEKQDIPTDEFAEMLEEKSVIELMETLG